MISDQTFSSLAFPVVRVRYAGPTDAHGSRWIATLGKMGYGDQSYRAVNSYRSELSSGSDNALPVARECMAKAMAESGNDPDDYVAIPGSLDPDTYVFVFVPRHFFEPKQKPRVTRKPKQSPALKRFLSIKFPSHCGTSPESEYHRVMGRWNGESVDVTLTHGDTVIHCNDREGIKTASNYLKEVAL